MKFNCGNWPGYMLVALLIGASSTAAQEYPTKPIRIIVSTAPVGSSDIFARLAGAKLTEALGVQVLVDNRPGASGMIALQRAAKSPPDGYTLLLGNQSALAINVSLFKSVPYDPLKDFQPITEIAELPMMLVVHPSLPVKSVRQLVALARQKPGELQYGSGLSGSGGHLAAELLKWLTKIDVVMVPYKSGTPYVLSELAGGQTSMVFGGVPAAAPFIKSGKLRPLGVTSTRRVRAFPAIPTIAEAGVPGYQVTLWYGLLAPAGTAHSVINKLNGILIQSLSKADVESIFTGMGADVAVGTPEEFSALIRDEIKKWGTVIKAAGIVPG